MKRDNEENFTYAVGYLASAVAHLVCAIVAIFVLESGAADNIVPNQIFSVTLEGGQIVGGISQVPDKDAKKEESLPNEKADTSPEESQAEKQAEQRKLDKAAAIELQDKKNEEAKKKAIEQKKKQDEAKKKADELKKKQEADNKKKLEDAKARREAAEKERKERDQRLQNAINKAVTNYKGESANAGGQGFGAAALGGKGMGGGTLASLEFIAYRNELEAHIKRGWHWLPGNEKLVAQVLVRIQSNGVIQDARIAASSGIEKFDSSALRAVYKASPVPVAPEKLYEQFREVRITFDSHQ